MHIKKNCANIFLIFFNCYYNNISEALYYVSTLFDKTNTILLIIIEKNILKKNDQVRVGLAREGFCSSK